MEKLRKYLIILMEAIIAGGCIAILLSLYIHNQEALFYSFMTTLSAGLALWIFELL